MNDNDLQVVIRNSFYRITHVLNRKGKEYAPGEDRLSNFKKAAHLQGLAPEQALFGMLAKHLVSLSEMVGALPNNDHPWPVNPHYEATWEEKLTDSINYLFLLEALVRERYGHRWANKGPEETP